MSDKLNEYSNVFGDDPKFDITGRFEYTRDGRLYLFPEQDLHRMLSPLPWRSYPVVAGCIRDNDGNIEKDCIAAAWLWFECPNKDGKNQLILINEPCYASETPDIFES